MQRRMSREQQLGRRARVSDSRLAIASARARVCLCPNRVAGAGTSAGRRRSWPSKMQGGVWQQGRHSRGKGATADAEKLSTAAVQGWRVLVVVEAQITSGEAVRWIEQALSRSR